MRGPYLRWLAFYGSCFEPAVMDRFMKHDPAPLSTCPYGDFDTVMDLVEAQLAPRPWLLGEQYSLADIIVAPLIDRMADLGMDHLWTDTCPRVADWYARMQQRPAFQATFYPGSRMSEFLPLTPAI